MMNRFSKNNRLINALHGDTSVLDEKKINPAEPPI
jgi:hypothetical protein